MPTQSEMRSAAISANRICGSIVGPAASAVAASDGTRTRRRTGINTIHLTETCVSRICRFAMALTCLILCTIAAASSGSAVVPLSPRQVTLEGSLGRRHERNIDYLLHLHEQHGPMMIQAFAQRGQRDPERPWDGEYAGKWLDAAALSAASGSRQAFASLVRSFANQLAATQEPDGYMGIEPAPRRGRAPWDIWNHWYAITGFLTCAQELDAPALIDPARRAANWLVEHYGPTPGSDDDRFFRGAWGGGCNVAVLDQLARLLPFTDNDPRLLHFIQAAARHYPPFDRMRRIRQPNLSHAYVVTAGLGGLVEFARYSADYDDLPWIQDVWTVLHDRHLFPSGSLGFNESLTDAPTTDMADGKLQETCATVEWILLSHRLYCATGQPRYADAIERAAFNALPAAQSLDGMQWTYFTPFRYRKRYFEGPTRCCYWSGPRGIARLPTFLYTLDAEGLRVDLYEYSTATIELKGTSITIRQRPDLSGGVISIDLRIPTPRSFTLKLRLAPWMNKPELHLNARPIHPEMAGGYLVLNRHWQPGDALELRFAAAVQTHRLGDGSLLAQFGPWILAVDEQDNPDLDLDSVRLPASLVVQPLGSDAGGRLRFTAELLVASISRRVTLITYADAGQTNHRFRAAFPSTP